MVLFKHAAPSVRAPPPTCDERVYATIVSTKHKGVYALFCRGSRVDVGVPKLRDAIEEALTLEFSYMTFKFV